MKQYFLSVLMLCMTLGLSAQSYHVATDMKKKHVLVEEFTGVRCPACPLGHQAAASLKDRYGDRISVVAIHTRSFSYNDNGPFDLRVPDGEAVAAVVGGPGSFFPNCVVNRRDWTHSGDLHMGVENMGMRASQVMAQNAPVNLWAEAVLDEATSEVKITIEGYFTQNVPAKAPCLHLFVTQNKVLSTQANGGMGNEYVHNHLLRDVITPAEGKELTSKKRGEYFVEHFTYTLPESYKKIKVEKKNIEMIAFVTNGQRDVINALNFKLTMKSDQPTGIEEVEKEQADGVQAVYNMAGMKVGTSLNVHELPRGVYLVRSAKGCEKVFVR